MKTDSRIVSGALASLLLLAGVVGCGNKGPLVMPVRPAAEPAAPPASVPAQALPETTPQPELPATLPADADSEVGR